MVIIIDSQAMISDNISLLLSKSLKVLNYQIIINNQIENGEHIFLQRIPAYCTVENNERAECLPMKISASSQPCPSLEDRTDRRIIKTKLKTFRANLYKTTLSAKSWSSLRDFRLSQNLPSEATVACFRVLTRHDYLQRHIYDIGLADSPLCSLCDAN